MPVSVWHWQHLGGEHEISTITVALKLVSDTHSPQMAPDVAAQKIGEERLSFKEVIGEEDAFLDGSKE